MIGRRPTPWHRAAALAVITSIGAVEVSSFVAPAIGRADTIERVVALVNDEAIFLSELRQVASTRPDSRAAFSRAVAMTTETERRRAIREVYEQTLRHMIDDRLIMAAAGDSGLTVSATEVDQAITNVRSQAGLDAASFWSIVREQGLTEETYRRDIRQQLLRYKVLNERVRNRVNITEDDVRRRYDSLVAPMLRRARFDVAMITIPVAPGSGAATVADARQRAEAIRHDATDAASFEIAMDDHDGVELGTVAQGELEPALENALLTLDEGAISQPIRGETGYFLFLLRRRSTGADQVPPYDQVRQDLYRQMLQDAMGRQETSFLEELRREATIELRLDATTRE